MPARKPTGYKVIAAAAVIRKGTSERYLYRNAVVPVDALDEENAKHLLSAKLIEPVFPSEKETADAQAKEAAAAKAKADADAANKKAADDADKKQTPPAS